MRTGVLFNVPNQITSARFFLTVILFGLIAYQCYFVSLLLFVLASATDWLDGYYARKYDQVTMLGGILDPFVDKILICGTFISLTAVPSMARLLPAIVVVVIVGRELLVTALRSFIEERGSNFSAKMSGKLKMVLQCTAAAACLLYLSCLHWIPGKLSATPIWLCWVITSLVWLTLLATVYSGAMYVVAAARLLRQSSVVSS